MNQKCKNHPDRFCYICGKVTLLNHRARITHFVKKSYHAYFGVKLGNQDKPFAPHFYSYFCMTDMQDINHKNKSHVHYPNVPSAIIITSPHGPGVSVPEPDVNMELLSKSEAGDVTGEDKSGTFKPEEEDQPVPLSPAELNDLTRDLNLSKESAQLLGSHLGEKHLVALKTTFFWYRNHKKEF
ncbi:uncharacterized protein [Panulirus ornatus]|uniref:uncharacterized protein n=1 Tax=Panulirus ornatus TaxID=150431 RepID=UPI003A876121